MSQPDSVISLEVAGSEILVTLRGTSYAVIHSKRGGAPGLLAKDFIQDDDPCITVTSAEFLELAWKIAIDKARQLGWIGET
jgi:hypothetical protein